MRLRWGSSLGDLATSHIEDIRARFVSGVRENGDNARWYGRTSGKGIDMAKAWKVIVSRERLAGSPPAKEYYLVAIWGLGASERLRLEWPVAGLRSGNELKAGHGEPTEPGQRVKAVALVDVHDLVDLADDEDVGSQGVVDAAYKDRHSSPRVVGATIHIAA
jgi:hypothetical protein